jgi:hypothetical protein
MKFSEFPHDMRVLIDQITEDAGVDYVADDVEIPVGMVPTSSFPARIQGQAAGDDRQFEDYLETPIEEYPPVLVAHGYWVDGRHRLWAARARNVQEIQTADISALVPASYIKKARFLGKMRRPVGLSLSGPGEEKTFRFSELGREHQAEIAGNLGLKTAKETVWKLVPDFPVDQAAALAWDTSIQIFDDDVDSVARQIEREGKVTRPILIDDLSEEHTWMEGRHRSIASEKLGLKTIPALYRIE